MSQQTQANNAAKSAILVISGSVDPTAVAVEAVKGTLYVRKDNGTLYQKQDDGLTVNWVLNNAAGGGGGGGTPVLAADPGAPALDEQWILRTAPTAPTFITGVIGQIVALKDIIDIAVPAPTAADFLALGGGQPVTQIDVQTGLPVSDPSGIDVMFNNGLIQIFYDPMAMPVTVQQVVDQINVVSFAAIGKNIAAVGGGVLPGDDMDTQMVGLPELSNIATDAVIEAYVLKIQGAGGVFTQPYTAP